MKTYLHKLPEGFILTSDETPKNFDWVIDDNCTGAWQLQIQPETDLSKYEKVIAQQHQLDLSTLPKQIELFDVEKLTKQSYERFTPIESKLSLDELIQRTGGYNVGFKEGFQKAQELLSDKQFTKEDMWKFACNVYNEHYGQNNLSFQDRAKNMIQSLTKTSWEVEVEMKTINQDYRFDVGQITRPNFVDGKIKVLKLL